MARTCSICVDGQTSTLEIRVFRPRRVAGAFRATAQLLSQHFDVRLESVGEDEIQAVVGLLDPVLARLQSMSSQPDVSIYWLAPGDLLFGDFWRYLPARST